MREAPTIGIREVVHRRVDDELLNRDALPVRLVGQRLPTELVELDLNPGSHKVTPSPSRITVRASVCLIACGPPGDRERDAPDIPRRRSDTDHTIEARWCWMPRVRRDINCRLTTLRRTMRIADYFRRL
jgi:hypothetical protein